MTTNQLLTSEGVFEITDHTTASDWERFISGLEDIFTDWKLAKQTELVGSYKELTKNFISSGLWHEKRDSLKFGNVVFEIRYQYLDDSSLRNSNNDESNDTCVTQSSSDGKDVLEDFVEHYGKVPIEREREHGEHELPEEMPECLRDMASKIDFASKAHCLVRWYNLRRFILIIPRGDTIVSEARVKLILSSASIAAANLDCHVPIFLQIHNPKNNFYQGISEHLNIRTMYEMILHDQNSRQYAYLSELVKLFREKASCNLGDPISVAIRLNYCLDFFDLFIDPREVFEGNEHSDDEETDELVKMTANKKNISKMRGQDMRSGATFDQVKEALVDCLPHPFKILKYIHVAALWPEVSDKVMTDSQVHSDLDPAEAPIWTIRIVTSDNCNLKIVHDTQAINELLLSATKFAYEKLDASQVFTDCDRKTLEERCLNLSYRLATQPEVVLSESPSDSIRKIIAVLFQRAFEMRTEIDALDQIAGQLKKLPSTGEIYRDFKKINQPSVKEFILRTQVSRPFNPISTPALPQRMFCTISENEFRLCGAFSELCN